LTENGDHRITWSTERLELGEPEAEAAVCEAERLAAAERGRGASAFRVRAGAPAERTDRFDRLTDDVVLIPPMTGG